jgi:hypothetical protein
MTVDNKIVFASHRSFLTGVAGTALLATAHGAASAPGTTNPTRSNLPRAEITHEKKETLRGVPRRALGIF